MKKTTSAILSCLLSLSLFAGCQFQPRNTSDRDSQSSDGIQTAGDSESLQNGSSSAPLTPLSEKDDLSTNGCTGSRAPENYGTLSKTEIQSHTVSEASTQALKGTFNNIGAPVYNGSQIWTFAEFNLTKYYGESIDLRSKTFQMDVYTENCDEISSIIVIDSYGNFSEEKAFNNDKQLSSYECYIQKLSNGWRRITLHLSNLFANYELTDASYILIMFSNVNSDSYLDSVFYLDNAHLGSAADFPDPATNIEVYNPDGYYSKENYLKIKIAGNSFIATSECARWLEQICTLSEATVYIDYLSIGNGRISDQTEAAFSSPGYMYYDAPDVLFIQDFYGYDDVINLAVFLNNLNALSKETNHNTEVKIFPAENETNDGISAARLYELDLVDWKGLIKALKYDTSLDLEFPFTSSNLNYPNDEIMHSNELAGFFGAVMMYASLYGELPDMEETISLALNQAYSFIPGDTSEAKQNTLMISVLHAAEKAGLFSEEF